MQNSEAVARSMTPAQIKKRLLSAKSLLIDELRDQFKAATFDKAANRLLSANGKHCLEWRLRYKPNEPISYDNQQTTVGVVVYRAIK